ncbi:MAG: EamA/RhaT family transporter [Phenylobacterium sp.]|nr:MAG: EamA/RhaT family transporter [Phenylobacterium sp.]
MAPQATGKDRWQAIAVLLFGACAIGFSPIFVRLAGQAGVGPAAAGFWRLIVALPVLAVMTRRISGPITQPSRIALIAGVMFALDLGFWHYGIKYTSVTNATVLSNLTPVVVTAFAWIFLKQRPRALFLLAVAVAVGGSWMMAVGKNTGAQPVNAPLGNLLSITTALWYALYMLAIGEGRKRETASTLMFWSSVVGAPLMLAGALLLREQVLPTTLMGLGACLGLGVMHVAGQGSIAWAMGRLPTSTASVVVLVQPVVAAWLGYVLFAEAIGPMQALGAGVALAGVVLAQWASRPRPATARVSA